MKCLTFTGAWYEVAAVFNKWAQGKPLCKDVIIHSHQNVFSEEGRRNLYLTIVVFFDEELHPKWVATGARKIITDPIPAA